MVIFWFVLCSTIFSHITYYMLIRRLHAGLHAGVTADNHERADDEYWQRGSSDEDIAAQCIWLDRIWPLSCHDGSFSIHEQFTYASCIILLDDKFTPTHLHATSYHVISSCSRLTKAAVYDESRYFHFTKPWDKDNDTWMVIVVVCVHIDELIWLIQQRIQNAAR